MLKQFSKIWGVLLTVVLLTSCSLYSGKNEGKGSNYGSLNDPDTQEGPRAYGSQQKGDILIHQNTKLSYNRDLSNKVGALYGVRYAIVMMTDHNAYVAILIDNSASGTKGPGGRRETNNTGTSWGTYDPKTLNQAVDPRELATGVNNYETVEDPRDLSPAFKQKIAVTIRKNNPAVYDVYISANRNFINLMNTYAQESWRGTSLDNHVLEFNDVVNQHFSLPDTLLEKR